MRFRSAFLPVVAVVVAGCALADSTQPSVPAEETFAPSLNVDLSTMTKLYDDLYIKDIEVGTGTLVAKNKIITVFYSGYLKDGTLFDSNVGKDSARFILDQGLITGWQLGLPGMKAGGTRQLVIGSSFGYGATRQTSEGHPDIPPHSTLVFTVQVKRVE
jgi:FKBP-type peptidyl-prolyl cis-trans isomerase